jgi:hypothetical protein
MKMLCSYFGWLPDGREFHAMGLRRENGVVVGQVIALSNGTRRDSEGTKTIWKYLMKFEQYEVRLRGV